MARPIEKKDYQDSDERVATFRITHGKLTAFQDVCAAKGTSVSQALIGFIDTVIGGGDIPEKGSHVSLPENLATQDDISKAIAQLETKFQNELGEFKSFVADTAPTLDGMNAVIAPLKEEIEALKKQDGIE
jgi:peptidoglycan hydrolase CwlO-like protein